MACSLSVVAGGCGPGGGQPQWLSRMACSLSVVRRVGAGQV